MTIAIWTFLIVALLVLAYWGWAVTVTHRKEVEAYEKRREGYERQRKVARERLGK